VAGWIIGFTKTLPQHHPLPLNCVVHNVELVIYTLGKWLHTQEESPSSHTILLIFVVLHITIATQDAKAKRMSEGKFFVEKQLYGKVFHISKDLIIRSGHQKQAFRECIALHYNNNSKLLGYEEHLTSKQNGVW